MWTSLKNIFGIFAACAEWFEKAGLPENFADKLASYSVVLLILFVLTSVAGIALKFSRVVREAEHPNPVGAVMSRIVLALGSMIGIPAIAAIVVGLKRKSSLILSFYTPFSQATQLEFIINIVGIVALLMIGILLFSFVTYLIHETQKLLERFKWWGAFEMLNACLYGFLIIILLASVLLGALHLVDLNYKPYVICFAICTVLYIVNECSVQFDRRKKAHLGNKSSIGYLVEVGDKTEEEMEDGRTKKIEVITPEMLGEKPETKKEEPVEEKKESSEEVKETKPVVEEKEEEATVEPEEAEKKTEEVAEENESNQTEAVEETESVKAEAEESEPVEEDTEEAEEENKSDEAEAVEETAVEEKKEESSEKAEEK